MRHGCLLRTWIATQDGPRPRHCLSRPRQSKEQQVFCGRRIRTDTDSILSHMASVDPDSA
jgi:hypothetical protein